MLVLVKLYAISSISTPTEIKHEDYNHLSFAGEILIGQLKMCSVTCNGKMKVRLFDKQFIWQCISAISRFLRQCSMSMHENGTKRQATLFPKGILSSKETTSIKVVISRFLF